MTQLRSAVILFVAIKLSKLIVRLAKSNCRYKLSRAICIVLAAHIWVATHGLRNAALDKQLKPRYFYCCFLFKNKLQFIHVIGYEASLYTSILLKKYTSLGNHIIINHKFLLSYPKNFEGFKSKIVNISFKSKIVNISCFLLLSVEILRIQN